VGGQKGEYCIEIVRENASLTKRQKTNKNPKNATMNDGDDAPSAEVNFPAHRSQVGPHVPQQPH
jgi:hypothetical protein